MKNKTPNSGKESPAVDHEKTILEALERYEELYEIKNLSKSKSAFRVVERFIEITDWSSPEGVADLKSKEIAMVLFDIGMREDPGQFGEAALKSTQPLEYSENDSSNASMEEQRWLLPKNMDHFRISHKLVLKLSREDESQDNYEIELSALADFHRGSDKLGLPRDYFIKRMDKWINGPEKPNGPIADERPDCQVNCMYRPPEIELLSEQPYLLDQKQIRALWRLVDAACMYDDEKAERQDIGSTTASQNNQAIRELIRKLEIDEHFKNSGNKFSRIWMALTELLALVNCYVEPDEVRQIFNNRKQ